MSALIATFFYTGHLRPAPGTWGSLAALPAAWVIHGLASFWGLLVATLICFVIGWWATADVTREAENHDPSEVVIDEVVGQWIALWPVSFGMWFIGASGWDLPFQAVVAAFVLFRFFDITKIGPVGWADRRNDPLGVMLDDVIAGFLAAAVLFLAAASLPWAYDALEFMRWLF